MQGRLVDAERSRTLERQQLRCDEPIRTVRPEPPRNQRLQRRHGALPRAQKLCALQSTLRMHGAGLIVAVTVRVLAPKDRSATGEHRGTCGVMVRTWHSQGLCSVRCRVQS